MRIPLPIVVLSLVLLASPAAAQAPSPREMAVRAALDSFVVDFNALDSARFAARWARTASAVLPFPDTPHRLDGRDAVLARFMTYFRQMRKERPGPPYLFIVVRNVRIDLLGDESAMVAYEFDAAGRTNRRSLLMQRESDGAWRIRHLHGSAAP